MFIRRLLSIVISAISAACGIAMMIVLSDLSAIPLSTIPFATSIVLVASAPQSAPASTKSIIFGHLICAVVGFITSHTGFHEVTSVAVAIGISVALMLAFDVLHPPAGITPLVIYSATPEWTFLLVPVLLGAVSVAILARTTHVLHSLVERWPQAPTRPAAAAHAGDQGDQR